MSEDNQKSQQRWTSAQIYVLAAICLLVGITIGYLFHGSAKPQAGAASTAQTQTPPASPAGALPANSAQPTPTDMKRMADVQVAPLLAKLKENPKDTELLNKVAHYYMVAKQFHDASTYYEKAVAIKPSPAGWTQLAVSYYYGNSGEKAIDALNQALKLDPKDADALFDLGMLKWQVRNDPKGALACWNKLLKTHPNHPRRAQVEKMIAELKAHSKMSSQSKAKKP